MQTEIINGSNPKYITFNERLYRNIVLTFNLYSMTAQVIYLVMLVMGLLLMANKHGKPRDNYNFWSYSVATVIQLSILYWGGFFDCIINV